MDDEKDVLFKAETVLDLPVRKEYCDAFQKTDRKANVWCIISILLLSYCTVMVFATPSIAPTVLVGACIGILIALLRRKHNGSSKKTYQELLDSYGGKTPHHIIHFSEDGFISHNIHKNTQAHLRYGQITTIIDADRLLLLVLDTNQCVTIDPRWLQGCTREELLQFLKERCNLPKKQLNTLRFGKILSTISYIVGVLLLIVTVVFSALRTPPMNITGSLPDNLSVRESAARLESMGIRCTDENITDAEDWEYEYRKYFPSLDTSFTTRDRILSLLCNAGYGSYDWDTWAWTPPDSGVYWLDLEAFDLTRMYTNYLTGISSLSDGAFVITGIEENFDDADWETGTGNICLSFTLNGTTHNITAAMNTDWYDDAALDNINQIINACGENNIYIASDGGQGILVFYRSTDWASEFTSTTGINLYRKLSSLWYDNPF